MGAFLNILEKEHQLISQLIMKLFVKIAPATLGLYKQIVARFLFFSSLCIEELSDVVRSLKQSSIKHQMLSVDQQGAGPGRKIKFL